MSTSWLLNLAGVAQTEEQLEFIPYPRVEHAANVTLKTVHAGTIAGVGIVGPSLAVFRGLNLGQNTVSLFHVAKAGVHCGRVGALIGLIVGPAIACANNRKLPVEAVRYKCWVWRQNRNEQRVDRGSLVGAAGGYTMAVAMGESALAGGVFGLCGGIIAAEIFNVLFRGTMTPSIEAGEPANL